MAELRLTMGYDNTESTRIISLDAADELSADIIKNNVQNFNANLSDVEKQTFVSDDYDGNTVGTFKGIIAAQHVVTLETQII